MLKETYLNTLKAVIGKLELTESLISHLHGWGQTEYNFIKFCLENNIVDLREVRELVHTHLLVLGRKNYDWLFEPGPHQKWPDHSPSPVALAYAIEHGEFSAEELTRIEFDHDDTADTFMQEKRKKLLDTMIQNLSYWMHDQAEPPT